MIVLDNDFKHVAGGMNPVEKSTFQVFLFEVDL